MSKKLTLAEKKLLNEHVTGETKRCFAIVNRFLHSNEGEQMREELIEVCKEIIEGSPYIEFHPELLKRIPE